MWCHWSYIFCEIEYAKKWYVCYLPNCSVTCLIAEKQIDAVNGSSSVGQHVQFLATQQRSNYGRHGWCERFQIDSPRRRASIHITPPRSCSTWAAMSFHFGGSSQIHCCIEAICIYDVIGICTKNKKRIMRVRIWQTERKESMTIFTWCDTSPRSDWLITGLIGSGWEMTESDESLLSVIKNWCDFLLSHATEMEHATGENRETVCRWYVKLISISSLSRFR